MGSLQIQQVEAMGEFTLAPGTTSQKTVTGEMLCFLCMLQRGVRGAEGTRDALQQVLPYKEAVLGCLFSLI